LPEYSKQSEIKTLSKTIQAKPKPLASFKHTFSHYHLILEPIEIELDNADDLSLELEGQLSWHSKKQLTKLGLAKPIQELLKPHQNESALSPA
jgi:A/G-specific adenine glycosylase